LERKTIFREDNSNYKPLKMITKKDLKGWEIGSLTILCKNPNNKLRNLVCDELNIKSVVFSRKKIKKKKSK
jgi:hypothetical protein